MRYCYGPHCSSVYASNTPRPIGKKNGHKIAFLTIAPLRKHIHELSVLLHEKNIEAIGL